MTIPAIRAKHFSFMLAVAITTACAKDNVTRTGPCDSDNAGLQLPKGFCAKIYADRVGVARHIVVAPNGDVYVALEDPRRSSAGTTKLMSARMGIAVLRDTTGDGRADVRAYLGSEGGSGLALTGDTLFFSTPNTVYRYRINRARFRELFDEQMVVMGIPGGGHTSRSLALGDSGAIYVNIGSAGNVCEGQDPCPELSERAGIWRFDRNRANQTLSDGVRYATGIRNAVGLAWNEELHALFATQHGRDALGAFDMYSVRDNDALPSEEFMRVQQGDDFGWPYCYHDWRTNKMTLGPEYGGDGSKQGRCANVKAPLMGFPGHWAPDGLIFYRGSMLPERYRGGAFIVFHGSWNRHDQDGYKVVFVPFANGAPKGDYEIFADGFAGRHPGPRSAQHRPVGIATGPDGSLYITDDQRGRIYNIRYRASQ